MDDVLEFIVEKVIPLMVTKLDFSKEELLVKVQTTAFFSKYEQAVKEFSIAYVGALQELETQCKQKLDFLTAKYTAINDIVRLMKYSNSDYETPEKLQNKQDEVRKELDEITKEYNIIQNAKYYVNNIITKLYK